jgi:predicted Na+-dependent transporter
MNIKRIFGAILTVLGTGGLIYAAILFVNTANESHNIKALIIYGILGLIFFIAGIGLIRTTKDES